MQFAFFCDNGHAHLANKRSSLDFLKQFRIIGVKQCSERCCQTMNDTKEHLIRVTTELIEQSNGNIKDITARTITEKAGVGLGLLNYHFGSKENLITLCVQRIISQVVLSFSPDKKDNTNSDKLSDEERLTDWAIQVYDFLFAHPAISRISILGDFENYQPQSNSAYTQKGFSHAIQSNMAESDKKLLTFLLTSAMQTAFLSGETAKTLLGYDLTVKEERDAFIRNITAMLFHGVDQRD